MRRSRRRIIDSSVVPRTRRQEAVSQSQNLVTQSNENYKGHLEDGRNRCESRPQKPWELRVGDINIQNSILGIIGNEDRFIEDICETSTQYSRLRRSASQNQLRNRPNAHFYPQSGQVYQGFTRSYSVRDTHLNKPLIHYGRPKYPYFDTVVEEIQNVHHGASQFPNFKNRKPVAVTHIPENAWELSSRKENYPTTEKLGNDAHRSNAVGRAFKPGSELVNAPVSAVNKDIPVYIDYVVTETNQEKQNTQENFPLIANLDPCDEYNDSRNSSPVTEILRKADLSPRPCCDVDNGTLSSLPFPRSTGTARSIRSLDSATLLCYGSDGLFDHPGAITLNSAAFNIPCRSDQLDQFNVMWQKMNDNETKRDRSEGSFQTTDKTFVRDQCDRFLVSDLKSKDPHSIELELSGKEVQTTDSGQLPDLFEAIMSDFERDRLRENEASLGSLFQGDIDRWNESEVS